VVINACNSIQTVAFESMGWALDTTHLWQAKKINYFSSELEDGVHNIMHDYVGGAVGTDVNTPIYNRIYQSNTVQAPMSDVPSSAFDPIFYLHHCNIDRLWASWEYSFPTLSMTKDEFSQQKLTQYIFFDENGKSVTYNSNNEVYDAIRNVDYTYDFLVNKSVNLATVKKAKPRLFAAELVVGRVDTSIVITQNTPINIPVKLSKLVNAKSSQNATYSLEIDIAGSKPNHSKLVITLNNCNTGNLAKDANAFVAGVVGFFGLGHDHSQDSGGIGHMDGMDMSTTKKFTFDISSEIQQQLRRGFQFNTPIVGILPQNFDGSGSLTVKSIVIKEVMFLK
jgi:Common central domain of tyrosinase